MPEWDSVKTTVLIRVARLRVPIGFIVGILAIAMARPTYVTLVIGAPIVVVGEALRIWAAGHLEKKREVTNSGPYRWSRHPLYVGSSILGIGFAIATGTVLVAAVVVGYLGMTLTAAIKTEEAFLREQFGGLYDQYKSGLLPDTHRSFSVARAIRNREYRAVLGLLIVAAILWSRAST
jgi:protein-S-isoprenylcysteine O-methyltransferase Ste14